MAVRSKRFIVLMLTDREKYGFDEVVLRTLVALAESALPEHQRNLHNAVIGYFLTSASAVARVSAVTDQVEKLRQNDSRFADVGIGLGEGEMVAEFTWFGRYKRSEMMPLGDPAMDACRCADGESDAYHMTLNALQTEFNEGA